MSLSLPAIDRLFDRLFLTYGVAFSRTFEGLDLNAVKSSWAHELAYYASSKDAMGRIAWALDNLPERPPNVIEFRNICKRAPAIEAAPLPAPKANPERLKAEIAKLMGPAKVAAKTPTAGRDWAHRIVGRAKAGEVIAATTLRFAQEALAGRAH
jgi:hypothetical protein